MYSRYLNKFWVVFIVSGFLLLGIPTQPIAQQSDPLPLVKGIFALIPGQASIPDAIRNNPYVVGVSVRADWSALESQEGLYNWTSLDNRIDQAATAGKAVLLQINPGNNTPDWVYAAGAQSFRFIDDNPYRRATFCKEVTIPVPWDEVYLSKWTNFINALGQKYGNDPRVVYIRAAGGSNAHFAEMGLPNSRGETVSSFDGTVTCATYNDIANWNAIGYTSDKVIGAWKRSLDGYADAFPNHWITVAYMPLKIKDSLNRGMTVPRAVADYGYTTLKNRFMISRNSLAANFPEPPPPADHQYSLLWEHHPQIWLQMLWFTTGDTTCRNNGGRFDPAACDYNLDGVVDAQDSYLIFQDAIQTAVLYQTQVLEVYPEDIQNPAFGSILADASVRLGPPLFQNIQADVGGTHLTVSWETDEPSTARIAYGTTSFYGLMTSLDSSVLRRHRMTLTGLAPETTYHFQLNSWDSANNLATSPDLTATTSPNQGPVLAAIANKAVNEGQLLTFSVSAGDPEGDPIALSARQANGEPLEGLGAVFTDQGNGTGTFTWTPSFTQAGEYLVMFTADDGTLSDSETIIITVANVTAPDLITSSLSTTTAAIVPGGSFYLSNTIRNQGAAAAGSFTVAFSLSRDAVYGGTDDIAVSKTRSFSTLATGANSSASTTLTVPTTTPLGNYYVCAKADSGNTVQESDEANNGRCTTSVIQVTLPDLVMTAVSGPASGVIGAGAGLSNTVKNQGIVGASSFYIGFYLSTDATITTGDLRIGTRSVNSLAAGVVSSATTTLTIPATLAVGTYYIGAIADYNNTRAETNETNNALTGNTTVLTYGADLVVSAISGPASTTRGTSIPIPNTVVNQGTRSSSSFYIGLYLSTDAVITTSDKRIGTRYLSSLAAGASSSATSTVTIPATLAAGTYYIGAIADYTNAAKESDETNNALTGNQISVVLPDLVMTAVSGPASGVRGGVISLANTVANQGSGSAAAFYVGLYLSADATITTTDLRVGTRSVSSLAGGATSTATTSVTIPSTLTRRTYYIGAIADYTNTVKANNETNNAMLGNSIVVQ